MSEIMAIESIAEEYAKLLGYLTQTRIPFKKERGISDIDVLGYNPLSKRTLMIECKGWGAPDKYPSFDTPKGKERVKSLLEKMIETWQAFPNSEVNKKWNFKKLDEMWLIIPGSCDSGQIKQEIENSSLVKEIGKPEIRIIPIHELILELMKEVQKDKNRRRKRYANPALEFIRWFIRCYEKGSLELTDLDMQLSRQRRYDFLRQKYFKGCLNAVRQKAKERKAGVDTRVKALKVLSKLDESESRSYAISDMREEAKRLEYEDFNDSRIRVGLGTWVNLGVVIKERRNKENRYYIAPGFKDIVKKELKKLEGDLKKEGIR